MDMFAFFLAAAMFFAGVSLFCFWKAYWMSKKLETSEPIHQGGKPVSPIFLYRNDRQNHGFNDQTRSNSDEEPDNTRTSNSINRLSNKINNKTKGNKP
jgi:hypothetical protein